MRISREKIIKIYIFVVLYSSLLRLVLGRWGSIVADVATIILLFFDIYSINGMKVRMDKNIRNIFWFILILQCISVAAMFNSNITNTLYALIEYRKSYFQVIVLLVTYWFYKNSDINTNKIINYIAVISLPIILYGVKQYFWWSSIDNKLIEMTDSGFYTLRFGGHMRSVSIFSGPFHYGMFCVLMFVLYIYLWNTERKKRYFLSAVVSFVGSYCSITRTNIICGLMVVLIWYWMYWLYEKERSATIRKLGSLLIIVVMLQLIISGVFEFSISNNTMSTLIKSLGNISEDTRFTSRSFTWLETINYIIQRPLFGYGIGAAADTMSGYAVAKINVTPHSMFLKFIMELGIVGGLIYIFIFLIPISKINKIKNYRLRALYYGCTVCILLNGLVGSTVGAFPILTIYWVIVGTLLKKLDDNIN